MQQSKMARKVQYLELLLLLGILVHYVNSQQCSESLQASAQPCLMVLMNEFSSMSQSGGQSSSVTIMNILCKQEVKIALVCLFDAVKVCPALAPSLSSIPGIANMDSTTLESMCSAMIDFSANEVCVQSAFNSTRYISCIMSKGDMSGQDVCQQYRVTASCSLQVLQDECPSFVAAYNYSLRLSKPPNCSDVVLTPDTAMDGPCTSTDVEKYTQCGTKILLGLSQLSSRSIGLESMAGFLTYICGPIKSEVTCFLQGYEKCPKFKMNSDKTGLTQTFRAQPLKELVMTGCKNVGELEKHSECMMVQFESRQYQMCEENATKTYQGRESQSVQMSCNYYNAMKSCLHGTVGEKCDHGVVDYLYKWSSIIFDIEEKCTTAGASMVYSSFFIVLALLSIYFLL